jgi:cholesterol oxidase
MDRRTFVRRTAAGAAALGGLSWADAHAAEPPAHQQAIVIGSGYGGSVAALRLGQQGISTLVMEMGRAWNRRGWDGKVFCPTLLPDHRAMWFRSSTKTPLDTFAWVPIDVPVQRWAGILDYMAFGEIAVYAGRGVGGGSLINGGVAATPRPQELRRILPGVDLDELYRTYFTRARQNLGVGSVPREWFARTPIHQYSRVGIRSAERAGFRTSFVDSYVDYDYLQREALGQARRSSTAQEIYYGCNYGKRTLATTYLPAAQATGQVRIAPLTRATAIRQERDGRYVVSAEQISETGRVLRRYETACDYLFLGAGTMGTNELLLRARETGALPDLTDRIGEGWGNHGNVSVSCLNPSSPTGVWQTTMPAVGVDNRDDPVHPVFAEIAGQPTGFENFTTSYLGIADTPERARISYDRATDRVQLSWRRSQSEPAIAALRATLDPIVERNRMVYRRDLYRGSKAFGTSSTWHPLGGCVLGDATDLYGRVHGARRLYVTDGALLPGYSSVNPTLTIAALAERNLERVIAEDVTAA